MTPPEVLRAVEGHEPGRALDLGCGTGTVSLELAGRGWLVTGVDVSSHAIESARRKADWVSGATFVEGDVTRLSELGVDGPFDLVIDLGGFSAIPGWGRDDYVREVARVARPGATLLLFTFGPRLHLPGRSRTREPEIRRRFAATFELVNVEPGPNAPGAAWFTLRRRDDPAGAG